MRHFVLFIAAVAVRSAPSAGPPPIIEVCPVGVPEWMEFKRRCKGDPILRDIMGRQLEAPPVRGLYWDGSVCAFRWIE